MQVETEACTAKPLINSQKKLATDKKHHTAKKIASMVRNPSGLKHKNAGTPNLALDNQAIKRQKLDGGRSRQVLICFAFGMLTTVILYLKLSFCCFPLYLRS